jgi:hypothetical protein
MKLPKKWREVSLKQFIDISEVSLIDMDETDRAVKILSILSGWSEDDVLDLDIRKIAEYTRRVKFIYTPYKPSGVPTYVRIGAKRFYVNNDLSKLKGAEYIDFVSFCKDKDLIASKLPQILAIFLKPVNWLGYKKKSCYYKGRDGEYIQTVQSRIETAKMLDKIPCTIAIDLSGFFLKNWVSSIKAIKGYLSQEHKKTMENLNRELQEMGLSSIGDGALHSTI